MTVIPRFPPVARRSPALVNHPAGLQVKQTNAWVAQIPLELSRIESGNVVVPLRRLCAQFVHYQSAVVFTPFGQTGFIRALAGAF